MEFADILAIGDASLRQTLGREVTYSPGVGTPVTVRGVFDSAYVKVDFQQAGVSTQGPAVWLSLSDLPDGALTDRSATVTVGGVEYRRRPGGAQPDGLGGVLFLLHRTE